MLETPSDSQLYSEIDSQITYDDAEDREERRRAQEASNALKSQRSRPQQKNQQKDQVTTKTKPLPPPEESSYKLNVEAFWEGEKAAFDTQITKRQLLLALQEPQLFNSQNYELPLPFDSSSRVRTKLFETLRLFTSVTRDLLFFSFFTLTRS